MNAQNFKLSYCMKWGLIAAVATFAITFLGVAIAPMLLWGASLAGMFSLAFNHPLARYTAPAVVGNFVFNIVLLVLGAPLQSVLISLIFCGLVIYFYRLWEN